MAVTLASLGRPADVQSRSRRICRTRLSIVAGSRPVPVGIKKGGALADPTLFFMAEWTGFEPATTGVTGRYSNQLNYHSVFWWVLTGSNRRPSPCKGDALPAELSTQSAESGNVVNRTIVYSNSSENLWLVKRLSIPPAAGRASLRLPSGLCQP